MDDDERLRATWSQLMSLFTERRDAMFALLREQQLTPPHGHALMNLLHSGPTRMGDVAAVMACDASYVTVVADRLEELGLVERRSAPDDRRVKELVLTAKGERIGRQIEAVFSEPPAAVRALSSADQAALARIVRKLGADGGRQMAKTSRTLR